MNFEIDIEQCLKVLKQGGTILYPTDTIWGIGCDATNSFAAGKIIALKKRPSEKSFVVLVASERDVLRYVAAPDLSVFDYLEKTEKPTTVIYEHALGLAGNVIADNGSVAMRICRDEFCKHLIKRFRKPIVSTSANLSGEPSPASFKEINEAIIDNVDYVVQYRQHELLKAVPSSIIKWVNGRVEVLRS
ncbi:MAG TPA: L-threonylcarbamoyladenylate synthase [Chitinophagaceae bacterium]|jgi:L-threonylcarbamoyladenylate synthase